MRGAHRYRHALLGAALLMLMTGIAFTGVHDFWPLPVVTFIGTLNPGKAVKKYSQLLKIIRSFVKTGTGSPGVSFRTGLRAGRLRRSHE